MKFQPNRHSAFGRAIGDWLLFGLIGVVALLGLFAVSRSMEVQGKVAAAFQGWYEDQKGYDRAMKDVKTMNSPALVYFYASWCPYCKRFNTQILSDAKVREFVKNYPHVRIAPDNGQAERSLMDSYGATGYPSFYVVLPSGERQQVETHVPVNNGLHGDYRMKTPDEFIQAVRDAMGGS